VRSWLAPLGDPFTTACVAAERAFARVLGGSCEVPIAAYAVREGGELWLRGRVAEPDGSRIYGGEIRGPLAEASRLGETLAQRLLDEGAAELVATLSGGAA
jgi:hydroxymethylbilane synthase